MDWLGDSTGDRRMRRLRTAGALLIPHSALAWLTVRNAHLFRTDNNALRDYCLALLFFMIRSFRDADTAALAAGRRVRRWMFIERVALRKLRQLDIAMRLSDLRVPPGNRLEALKGDRVGQFSIRINVQYRLCFRWTSAGAEDVEIVDYH